VEWLFFAVASIILSIAVSWGRVALRRWLGRRAERSILRGGRPSIPVFVKGGRLRYARMARDGADVLIFAGPRTSFLVDARGFRDAPARVVVDEENEREGGLRTLRDPSGATVLVGPAPEYEPALLALAEAAPMALSAAARWAAAVPRSLLAITLVCAAPLLATQAVWWSGHDVQARVTGVVPHADTAEGDTSGDLCLVSWAEGERQYAAGVTCYEPYPRLGDALQVRALAGPLRGNALDDVETYPVLTTIFGGLTALGLLTAFGWTALRAGSTSVRLVAARRAGVPVPLATAPDDQASDFVEVATAVARAEGWADEPPTAPKPPGTVTELRLALADPLWFGVVVGAGVALGFLEGDTTTYALAGLVAVGVLAVVCLARATRTWRLMRRTYSLPFSARLPYVVTRPVDDTYTVFLLQEGRPRWAVDFNRGQRPPLTGTADIRGDLDSGAVHLRISGQVWVPDSSSYGLDDETVREVRESLRDVLEDSQR
jgi:hypothetical protein